MKILLFLLATFSIASAQTEPIVLMTTRTEGPPEPRLEVIALIDHGQFKNPNTYKDKGAFIRQYLPKGREFFVVFGGGAAGTLNLTSTGLGCSDLIYAIGPWNAGALGTARIHGRVQGLATNSNMIARSEIWRRAPSNDERAAALQLAKGYFSNSGVTAAQLTKMETVNLTAIDTDGDNHAELAGTFSVPQSDTNRPPRYLFLLAEGEGTNYKIATSSYRFYPKAESYNAGEEILIDYIDLDRNGTAEVVTSFTGEKDFGYRLYRYVNGDWNLVYETSTPLCVSEGGR
jgi:hypothetical protein